MKKSNTKKAMMGKLFLLIKENAFIDTVGLGCYLNRTFIPLLKSRGWYCGDGEHIYRTTVDGIRYSYDRKKQWLLMEAEMGTILSSHNCFYLPKDDVFCAYSLFCGRVQEYMKTLLQDFTLSHCQISRVDCTLILKFMKSLYSKEVMDALFAYVAKLKARYKNTSTNYLTGVVHQNKSNANKFSSLKLSLYDKYQEQINKGGPLAGDLATQYARMEGRYESKPLRTASGKISKKGNCLAAYAIEFETVYDNLIEQYAKAVIDLLGDFYLPSKDEIMDALQKSTCRRKDERERFLKKSK